MFSYLLIPIFFLGVQGQFLNCDWVNSLDCRTYSSGSECGTDGVTYPNRCYFAKEQCANQDLHILHDGDCLHSESSSTIIPPTSGINGEEAVLDFFCVNLSHTDCPENTTSQTVCGTDGWTYPNYCEYEKQRCTHRELHVANLGDCP